MKYLLLPLLFVSLHAAEFSAAGDEFIDINPDKKEDTRSTYYDFEFKSSGGGFGKIIDSSKKDNKENEGLLLDGTFDIEKKSEF